MVENQWLASLEPRDFKQLAPYLIETPFESGQMLFDAGAEVDAVWFPLRGVVSLMTMLDDDRMVETAAIGREGLVGVTCGPLNGRAVSRAVAQTEGAACCVDAKRFATILEKSDAMRCALARYTEALFAQVQQTAACNAQHRLEERFARWLLMLHDRADSDRFELTQEAVAGMLGVRRATVSEVGAALEKRGLIRRGRGRVEVLNRKALEHAACGCYSAIRRVMDDLDIRPEAA